MNLRADFELYTSTSLVRIITASYPLITHSLLAAVANTAVRKTTESTKMMPALDWALGAIAV